VRTLLLPRNTGFEFGISAATQTAEFHFPNFVRALLSAALTMNPPNFFAELKRRNVFRVAGLYLVGAWLLTQVASTVLPMFGAPEWLPRSIVILLAIGFVPTLIFSWVFELTPEGLKRDEEVPPEQSIAPQTARRMDRMIIVVLVLALAYFGFDKFVLAPRREAALFAATAQSRAASTPNEPGPAANAKSIAVLPFENLSEDKANAYFAIGIQEEILTRLAKIADLKVISRTSTQQYQSKPGNLSEIAKQLGVANILEGSVQKAADQVRVNVQLIQAPSDAHLWADTYDRKLTDVFVIETEIAKAIADKLKAKLTGREEEAIRNQPTENPEAHQLYLKGRYFWNKRTSDGLKTSIDYFNQAIDKDPAYGPAYAGLADAYAVLPNYSRTPGKEAYPKAEAAAVKALEIDDKLAEAHIALANVRVWHKWAKAAEPEFKRGLERNPNYSTGHQWYSIYLSLVGRHDEAILEMEKAKELDPFSIIINTELGCPYLYSRRYDRAIEYFTKAVEMDSSFPFAHFALAEAYDRTGRFNEALAEHEKAIDLAHRGQAFDLAGGDAPRAWYALTGPLQNAYGALRGPIYWQGRLESAKKLYEQGSTTATALADIYSILGDKEQALASLAKAYEESDDFLVFINIQPQFDKLHSDSRFQALVNKIFESSAPVKNE
jgi:TolB-like protein